MEAWAVGGEEARWGKRRGGGRGGVGEEARWGKEPGDR